MRKFAMLVSALSLSAGIAFAQKDAKPSAHTPAEIKEHREKMAAHHEMMATCLRSDKPLSECKGEMHKSCGKESCKEGCPMMDGKGEHKSCGEESCKEGCPMMDGKGAHGHHHKAMSPKESKPAPKK